MIDDDVVYTTRGLFVVAVKDIHLGDFVLLFFEEGFERLLLLFELLLDFFGTRVDGVYQISHRPQKFSHIMCDIPLLLLKRAIGILGLLAVLVGHEHVIRLGVPTLSGPKLLENLPGDGVAGIHKDLTSNRLGAFNILLNPLLVELNPLGVAFFVVLGLTILVFEAVELVTLTGNPDPETALFGLLIRGVVVGLGLLRRGGRKLRG